MPPGPFKLVIAVVFIQEADFNVLLSSRCQVSQPQNQDKEMKNEKFCKGVKKRKQHEGSWSGWIIWPSLVLSGG